MAITKLDLIKESGRYRRSSRIRGKQPERQPLSFLEMKTLKQKSRARKLKKSIEAEIQKRNDEAVEAMVNQHSIIREEIDQEILDINKNAVFSPSFNDDDGWFDNGDWKAFQAHRTKFQESLELIEMRCLVLDRVVFTAKHTYIMVQGNPINLKERYWKPEIPQPNNNVPVIELD